jgi:hypothetical protein
MPRLRRAVDGGIVPVRLRKILNTICSDIPTPTCPPSYATCSATTACPGGTNCSGGCCFPIIQ